MSEQAQHAVREEATRERSLARDTGGATMVIGVFMAVLLVAMIYYVAGIGETIMYKETMQDAADSGAFGAAVMHARGMNLMALLNMVMAAVLAVLVALKLAYAVLMLAAGIASAICAACVGTCYACGAAVTLYAGAEYVDGVREAVKEPIQNIVEIGHNAGVGIQRGMPVAAQAKVMHLGDDTYGDPTEIGFMLPVEKPLAVEQDDSGYLCYKAGEQAAALFPLPIVGYPVAAFVPGYRGFIGRLAEGGDMCERGGDKGFRVVDSELGEERFQLRAFMKGEPNFEWSRRGVAIATWGRDDGTGDGGAAYEVMGELSKYSFAQAEYYYDERGVDRKEWLWHQKWRARLRRFSLGGVDPAAACSEVGGACPGLGELSQIGDAVVH